MREPMLAEVMKVGCIETVESAAPQEVRTCANPDDNNSTSISMIIINIITTSAARSRSKDDHGGSHAINCSSTAGGLNSCPPCGLQFRLGFRIKKERNRCLRSVRIGSCRCE